MYKKMINQYELTKKVNVEYEKKRATWKNLPFF